MRAFYPLRAREATQIEFEFIFVSRKLQCSVQFKNVVGHVTTNRGRNLAADIECVRTKTMCTCLEVSNE